MPKDRNTKNVSPFQLWETQYSKTENKIDLLHLTVKLDD